MFTTYHGSAAVRVIYQ